MGCGDGLTRTKSCRWWWLKGEGQRGGWSDLGLRKSGFLSAWDCAARHQHCYSIGSACFSIKLLNAVADHVGDFDGISQSSFRMSQFHHLYIPVNFALMATARDCSYHVYDPSRNVTQKAVLWRWLPLVMVEMNQEPPRIWSMCRSQFIRANEIRPLWAAARLLNWSCDVICREVLRL